MRECAYALMLDKHTSTQAQVQPPP